jgi:hypothetical protein
MKKKEKIEPIDISFSKLAKMIVRTKICKKTAKNSKEKNVKE